MVSAIKNSGLSKRLVVLRNLIVWTSISLLTVSLYLSEPNKRMSDNVSSFKFFKEISILNKLFRSFCLSSAKNGQHKKKWSVILVPEPQSHVGLGASSKLWRSLCSFKWLNFNRSLDNNLTRTGSWIAKRDFCFKLKDSLNVDLICLILLASLSELSSLYHSLTQKGKNDCLKC